MYSTGQKFGHITVFTVFEREIDIYLKYNIL